MRLDYSYYTVSAPEEQWVRAMANESHQNDEPCPTISLFNSSQVPTTSVQPPSASKASESVLSTHVGGKRKRNIKAKDGKGKKQKKKKKTRAFVVSDNEDNDDDDEEGKRRRRWSSWTTMTLTRTTLMTMTTRMMRKRRMKKMRATTPG